MRKWLILLTLAFACGSVSASTTTFSATLKRGDGTVPKVFLRLSFLNCGTYIPFVNSDHVITNPDGTFDLFPNTTTGVVSASVDDQATIKCGLSTGVGYYHIDVYQGDTTTSTARRKIYGCDYDITGGSFNMNATACKAAGTVTAPINAIQNVDNAGSLLNNRGTLNFFNGLQAADNAGSNRTDVSLITPVPIASGGTNATTANAGFNNLGPMTTLGDTIYENATPAGARLAGNTAASLKVLGQTGNGSTSAAPAWTATSGTGSVCMTTNCSLVTPTIDNIPNYGGVATVSGGVPAERATIDLTGQSATINSTLLFAVVTAGQYRVSWNAKVTTAATTSSTLGQLSIIYTDPDGVVITVPALAGTAAGTLTTNVSTNTTSTVLEGMPMMLNCKAGTNINYSMTYASSGGTAMQYNLHLKVEAQ